MTHQSSHALSAVRPLTLVIAAGCGLVAAVTFALWMSYGGAVFFEMIAAGIATCL